MCNVSSQSSHKMVTVALTNHTTRTISHRPIGAELTGNDSIEAGGLPDCELNCEKISRWTTNWGIDKYLVQIERFWLIPELVLGKMSVIWRDLCVSSYNVRALPTSLVVGNNHVETTLQL